MYINKVYNFTSLSIRQAFQQQQQIKLYVEHSQLSTKKEVLFYFIYVPFST